MSTAETSTGAQASLSEVTRVFGRIGLLSFGGPAAQIALMHKELVDDRPWLSEKQFLSALSFCMLLPGPEAMQLATYAGWMKRGVLGGLIAGGLFVLPGAAVILALALAYISYGDLPLVQAGFVGIQAAVVGVVFFALRKIAAKALKGLEGIALAGVSFLAIFVLQLPFPLVVLCAALWGALRPGPTAASVTTTQVPRFLWRPVLICLALWLSPIAVLFAFNQEFLLTLALFFSKLAIVTFGGAYAVLAYMTQTVVQDHGWLNLPQMIDALGLAETTPGPLILITQFVGTLAGHSQGGIALAIVASALTLWVTFIPCFLWIFAGAPYVAMLTQLPRLSSALTAITAAVTGVIANLSIWFALQVLFGEVQQSAWAPVPVWSSFSPLVAGFMILALGMMGPLKRGMMTTLLTLAALALALGALGVLA
ncbi:chromate efflux transporter [Thalassobius sp. MITS945101]|uniref:chromate efflux transporter n=1 Tax=Thalassobius sp. MITS945101 TaxID=3096994 RepID=UPI00399B639D